MRWMLIAALGTTVLGGVALAQRERLPLECRQEIMQLCRGHGGGFRQCIMTAMPKLSDRCRKASASAPRRNIRRRRGQSNMPMAPIPSSGSTWSSRRAFLARRCCCSSMAAAGRSATKPMPRPTRRAGPMRRAGPSPAPITGWCRRRRSSSRRPTSPAPSPGSAPMRLAQGLDPDRIVLMGHSAGAHLAALVGTDPRYLEGGRRADGRGQGRHPAGRRGL